jgi:serine/threonine protein kinase/Tfp pilus assembly protein PilF
MGIKCPKCQTDNPDTQKFCGECATPLPSPEEIPASPTETLETPTEELTTGSTFAGRYQIIEELGKGGMGKVYRALDKKLNEEVALKLIKSEIASDKKTLERFGNELKIARKIVHKNIGRMYELMEEKGTHYITLEYVPGQDLKGLIRQSRQLTVGTTISIAKQVCEGLSEAHKLGTVHRDLKPSNIMIDKEGNARIMDFGIARSLKAKGITGAGVMIGTPEYMSPEQAEVKEVDQRSDIYSLGVILYEMVTGRVPFEGETPLGIAMKHKSEVPKNPRELNAQLAEDLSRVILRCMEKDKEKRYQSAGEVRSELSRIEKGIPTTEREIPKRKPITSREITVQFSLKRLFIPAMATAALIIAVVIILQLLPKKEAATPVPDSLSIAVLPFVDLSPTKDHEYLCDGTAETLINALSKIKDLYVPARTSAFSFKGREMDVREIGQKLNVETILEGSVQVAGSRVRITARLLNVDDGYQLWSESYDREMADIFAVQDDIAQNIVDTLKVELMGEKKEGVIKHYTENREAYDSYMQGIYFMNKRGKENLEKAVELFKEAIEKDSTFALAYAGLAETYLLLGDWGILPPKEAFPKTREAAKKALEIDNSLAEAHTTLACVKYIFDWDWQSAEDEFKLAISLNPNYAIAHKNYGEYLTKMGRFNEAHQEFKRAQQLDPLSLIIIAQRGWPYDFSGQYDRAIEQYKKALEMDPNFGPAQSYLSGSYLDNGMYKEALELYKSRNSQYGIGLTYAMMGKKAQAKQIMKELMEKSTIDPYLLAAFHFALEENDQGFYWLEKAYENKGHNMAFLKVDPGFSGVRSDPRFKELLRKIGLE